MIKLPWKTVKVELDGKRVPPKTFEDYVKLYLEPNTPTGSMRITPIFVLFLSNDFGLNFLSRIFKDIMDRQQLAGHWLCQMVGLPLDKGGHQAFGNRFILTVLRNTESAMIQ